MDWRTINYETVINNNTNYYSLYNKYKQLLISHNELSNYMNERLNNEYPQTAPAVPVIESPERPRTPPPPPPFPPQDHQIWPNLSPIYDDGLSDSDDDMYNEPLPQPKTKEDICAEILNIIDSKKETMENQTYIDLLNKLTQIHNTN